MSQKDYKLEIIGKLIRSRNHIRGLANELKTNQMMISRKISELEQNNVVDFNFEGKNKVYFLKKTIESKQYVFLFEHYKVLRNLEKYPNLRKIFTIIKENSKIKLAVLFLDFYLGFQ
jgi:DNA-binding transcriptional ArsR family regulator